jgi:dihydrofolate synthase/folylpolyglutamate synthase
MTTRAEALLQGALKFGIRPGLDRMHAILHELGDPQRHLRVVHVAGTNGKGSTTAMLTTVLREAGYKVARYTSPHLVTYRERFWLDGGFISAPAFDALLMRVAAVAAAVEARLPHLGPSTEFELLTAAALAWFVEQKADLAVIEVGLGGRLDATNVFEAPEATVITGIDYDHTAILGETLEAIASEKAGILRAGVPLVTAASGVALETIRQASEALGAPCRVVEGESRLPIGLKGPYQRRNAAMVEQVVAVLRELGWEIPFEALLRGLATARWPGRMESWTSPADETWLADGAHNPGGVTALREALKQEHPDGSWTMIFGALADRDARGMLEQLLPFARTLVLVAPPSPRAMDPQVLAEGLRHPEVRIADSVSDAVAMARQTSGPYAVFGSLYLVGAVKAALGCLPEP